MNKKVIAYLRLSQGIVTICLVFLILLSFGMLPISDDAIFVVTMLVSLPVLLIGFSATTIQPYMVNVGYNLGFNPQDIITIGFIVVYLLWYAASVECVIRIFGKGKPFSLLSLRMHGYYLVSGIFFLLVYILKIYVTKPDLLLMPNLGIEYIYFNPIFDLFVAIGFLMAARALRMNLTWERVRTSKYFRAVVFGIIRLWQVSYWLSLLSFCLDVFNKRTFIGDIFHIAEAEVRHLMLPLSFLNEYLIINVMDGSRFTMYFVILCLCLSVLPLFWMEKLIHFLRSWFDSNTGFQINEFKSLSKLVWELYVLFAVVSVLMHVSRGSNIGESMLITIPWLAGGALSVWFFLWAFSPDKKQGIIE